MNQDKKNLRKQIDIKISELNSDQKLELSTKASQHLLEFLHTRKLKNICISYSLSDEIDTRRFIENNIEEFSFYLPKINLEKNTLGLHLIKDLTKDLTLGTFGILEPVNQNELHWEGLVECFVVPARALDIEGNRLGRGKGYYDRLLSQVNTQKSIIVCMIYHCQLLAEVPFEIFDFPIEYCITEKGVFHLRRKSK